MKHVYKAGLLAGTALLFSGCSVIPGTSKVDTLENELSQARTESTRLQDEVSGLRQEIGTKDAQLAAARTAPATATPVATGGFADLPPNALPGHCYARVLVPPQYVTESRQKLSREASERIEVSEPVYEWQDQRVVVREASKTARIIPAEYRTVEEQVLVKEASRELVTIPAEYETVSEQVLVRPAYSEWKKGRGPIEKIDNSTGEIVCLVEVPAEYKTVTTRKLLSPARTETREIPAVHETVSKRVMISPPRMVEEEIPAEYDTIKVRKLVRQPEERRIAIPAEYQTVQETRKVEEGYLQWREVLCETNTTPDVIRNLQTALKREGFNPGKIDGVVGSQTMTAIKDYQAANGLPAGQMTLEMLNSLNVF